MKVYRKSIVRVPILWWLLILYLTPVYLWIVDGIGNWTLLMCSWGFFTLMFFIISFILGYILILDDRFIIKNALYPFWQATYVYKEVKEIEFCHTGKGGPYLKIHLHNAKVKMHAIECVREKDLKEISENFKAHHIPVTALSPIAKEWLS